MTVYLLIREDQNEHGYIDTSVAGIFRDENDARSHEAAERSRALDQDLRLDDEESSKVDWQVSWKVEEHFVR